MSRTQDGLKDDGENLVELSLLRRHLFHAHTGMYTAHTNDNDNDNETFISGAIVQNYTYCYNS